MEHCAIDLGGRKSQVCVRASDGTIVHESRPETLALKEFLQGRPKSRVIVETCAEAFGVADAALALGHEVRVVSATLVRTLGVGARRTKTDRRDAQTLSEVSCRIDLPSVHVPGQRSREVKTICGMRDGLVTARAKLINTVRGWLRGQAVRISSGATPGFTARVREIGDLPDHLGAQLRAIDSLSREIKIADERVEGLAGADPVCRRLMTVPGIGAQTALRYTAALDDITRFHDSHRVEAYLGLVPGERSSSEREQRLSITKAGATSVRWLLVQAAWALRRCKTAEARPLQLWTLETGKDETQQSIDLGGPSDAIGRDRSRKVRSHSGQGGSILNSFRDGPHCVMRLNRSEIALAHRRLAGRDATPMSASERSAPREGGWFNRLNQRLEMRGQPRECAPRASQRSGETIALQARSS
jgi:transposase